MKLQSRLKTKVAKPLASWVLPCSCGRVRCLKALYNTASKQKKETCIVLVTGLPSQP